MEDGTFVGDTLPNFSDLFIGYEARIQATFDRIVAASSVNPPPKLQFTEEHSSMLFKCKPSEASVTADWHGIASLGAMSQGVGRLCAAMFNARRSGQARLDFEESSEAELGYHFIHEARALARQRGHDGTPISRNPTSSLIGWSLATYSSSGRSNGSLRMKSVISLLATMIGPGRRNKAATRRGKRTALQRAT